MIALQVSTGAYHVERGVYSDDAAHFMNGLVIRDYITSGLGHNPISFVESYYLSYPKVALLMWPPLFHVSLGLFLLPGWPPGPAALIFIAMIAAWTTWRLFEIVRRLASMPAAIAAAALLITTPIFQAMSSVVMLDVVIAALSLEAAWWLTRYAASGKNRDADIFGVFVAAACLTKGNGVSLVLMPPIFIVLTRRFDLLRTRGLYIAAAIVLAGAGPILAISEALDAAIGDFGPVTGPVVVERIGFYADHLWTQLSPALCLAAMAGVLLTAGRRRTAAAGALALADAMTALAIAAIAFHLVSPHKVSVGRYVTLALAPIIALAFAGVHAAIAKWPGRALPSAAAAIVAIGLAAIAAISRPAFQSIQPLGYRTAVADLQAEGRIAGQRVLVISDEFGEGAFVTEIAVLGLHPAPTVIRGSKLLASDDWMGAKFQLKYPTPEALLADLEALHISMVVVDSSAAVLRLPYFAQVKAVAESEPERFKLKKTAAGGPAAEASRPLTLYEVTRPTPGEPKPFEVSLIYSLGRSLKR